MPLKSNGQQLRRRRELTGMTLTEFTRRTGYSKNHVSLVELGKHNAGPRYLRNAAELLGCEIAEITDGEFSRRTRTDSDTAQGSTV